MSAASYNRGSRLIADEAYERARAASVRADSQAHKDEAARLRVQVAKLESDLARARRCIAELRRSKEARVSEARAELESSRFAISTLCRIAFPHDSH